MFNKEWNETIPANSEFASRGASRIRELKTSIRERLSVDHNFQDDEADDTDIGKHKKATFIEQESDVETDVSGTILYDKEGKMYLRKKNGDIVELIDNTNQTIDGVKTFTEIPVLPETEPTDDNQAVSKEYMETRIDTAISNAKIDVDLLLIVVDEKPAGTDGGTFTAGAWRTRDLNKVRHNTIEGASLDNNQITLPAGIYKINMSAPANRGSASTMNHKTKLRRITPSAADVLIGTTEEIESFDQNRSWVMGVFTITEEVTFEIQHHTNRTVSNAGLGRAYNVGVVEIYTQVEIQKIGEVE